MKREDIIIEVRDRNLVRKGQITEKYTRLEARLRHNGVGTWKITLPGDHPMIPVLNTPGSGIIISQRIDGAWTTTASGPTIIPAVKRDREQPDGTYTFTGVTDDQHGADARAFPSPAVADPGAQTQSNDVRVGIAETVMRDYVNANIGPAAPAGRKGGFRSLIRLTAADGGRGGTVNKSPRFQNLAELLSEIGTYANLGWRFIQRGLFIEFEVYEIADRTPFVRLDIRNGTLTSEEVQVSPPSLTRAIVAGQGEGTARTIIQRTSTASTASESTWGRVVEEFFDQRNTDVLAELQQAGDEALIERGFTATNVKVIPADEVTMLYGRDWREGDKITVVVEGVPTSTTVTEAVIIADSERVVVGAGIGDVRAFQRQDALTQRVEDTERRVESLERNAEVSNSGLVVADIPALPLSKISYGLAGTSDLDTITTQGLYECASGVNGTLANHYPIAGSAGILEVYVNGGHLFQRFTFRGDSASPANANRVWVRGKFSTNAWSEWRDLANGNLPDYQQEATGNVHGVTATTWAQVPGIDQITVVLDRPAWVQITFGAWMTAAAGDTRGSVQASGATVVGATDSGPGDGTAPWGQILYKAAGGTGTEQQTLTRIWKLNAGSTTIAAVGYQSGGGTHQINYPVLGVMPLRWAD